MRSISTPFVAALREFFHADVDTNVDPLPKSLYAVRYSYIMFLYVCCGADKHIAPANDLTFMRASNGSQRQSRKQRKGYKYNKDDNLLSCLQARV